MGSWGYGLQQNDLVEDCIWMYVKRSEELNEDDPDWDTPLTTEEGFWMLDTDEYSAEKVMEDGLCCATEFGNYKITLGFADWLIDLGYDLTAYKERLQPYIDAAYEDAPRYKEPEERKSVLNRFVRRLNGEEVSNEELEADRDSLTDKMKQYLASALR